MPIEATWLKDAPEAFVNCPNCNSAPFRAMMRGLVQRSKVRGEYCAVICSNCHEIVGYETAREPPVHPLRKAAWFATQFQTRFAA
jgi:hypothetical protein